MIFISSSVSSNYDHNKKDTFETYVKQFPFDNTAKGQMEGTVKLKIKWKIGRYQQMPYLMLIGIYKWLNHQQVGTRQG